MNLSMQSRAEIALRSLEKTEQNQVKRALSEISTFTLAELSQSSKFRILHVTSGEKLYIYRGNQKLRLVLSVDSDRCMVEDIVDHDRVDRLLLNQK